MEMEWATTLTRLALATALGGFIGMERESGSKQAGLRTHIILCVGSALLMLVSVYVCDTFGGPASDPARIAAQVVTGIGFLGAGAILRFGHTVRGLTTAAGIWTTAAIGIAVGAGYYFGAVAATALVLASTVLFDPLKRLIYSGRAYRRLTVGAQAHHGVLGKVEEVLENHQIEVKQIGMARSIEEERLSLSVMMKMPTDMSADDLINEISTIAGVVEVELD